MLDSDNPAEETATTEISTPDTAVAAEAPVAKKTAKKATAKKAATKAPAKRTTTRKTAAKKAAATTADQPALIEPPAEQPAGEEPAEAPSESAPVAKKTTTRKTAAKKAAAKAPAKKSTTKKAATKKAATKRAATKKAAAAPEATEEPTEQPAEQPAEQPGEAPAATAEETAASSVAPVFAAPLFQPPEPKKATAPRRKRAAAAPAKADEDAKADTADEPAAAAAPEVTDETAEETEEQASRRRRRRGGRRRRKGGGGADDQQAESESDEDQPEEPKAEESAPEADSAGATSRRRRRRRRAGEEGDAPGDDPENTVTRVRKARNPEDEITALSGSTRLEAKKQRRREGREAGRRRAPIVSEAEFLARREAVDRVMVIRQREDLTQIAVLEDKVLVEHYVARESQTSLIGNVYLGKVQNVLPSMEAAFIDIGKGRNAVLYAGEVNWDALGAGNGPRKIEQVLKSGQSVLVQVTKDPVGHKGARLTSQVSLPGRFLVYVPDGTTSGISRKLPDTERNRLKNLLKEIVPDTAGVIVRTAAEGASEEELTHDVERLTARWEDISSKVEKGNAPQLLYGEPDLTLKVVRDLFTEDFGKLVVSGGDAWDTVDGYVKHVAPDLADRLERYDGGGDDVFAAYRIDEQIAKALDRKVWLPSGGSLIIDRTEAMTVVDVNTGKFTGSGGNLEETVTKNNLEAAEEIIRQLRLRDIGGIIVVDFIDMVLESNRDLVLRRMVECLGRDRTRHQVAEVTSLGLVQMTRKRIGTGLLEAFSESCEHCQGRGLLVHHEPVEPRKRVEEEPRRGRRGRGRGKPEGDGGNANGGGSAHGPSPKEFAAMAGKPVEVRPDGDQPTDESLTDGRHAGDKSADERPEPVSEPAVEPAAQEPGAEPEPEAEVPATPPAPTVVTSSRRRGARRPVEPAAPIATEPTTAEQPAAVPEPSVGPAAKGPGAEPEPEAEVPATPPAPTVVTSSRRRVARRPAGPPSGDTSTATIVVDDRPRTAQGGAESVPDAERPATDGAPDPSADAVDGASAHAAAHVPVKRKGSRKR